MKISNILLITVLLFSFLILPVLAQSPVKGLGDAAPDIIKNQGSLPTMVGAIVKAVLGFLGVVFLCLILYAGYTWMTAAGEPDKVKKAKDMITASIIGIIIVLGSYSIAFFVVDALNK